MIFRIYVVINVVNIYLRRKIWKADTYEKIIMKIITMIKNKIFLSVTNLNESSVLFEMDERLSR